MCLLAMPLNVCCVVCVCFVLCVCMCVWVCACRCVCGCVHVGVCVWVCVYTCASVCVHACVWNSCYPNSQPYSTSSVLIWYYSLYTGHALVCTYIACHPLVPVSIILKHQWAQVHALIRYSYIASYTCT